MLLTTSSFSQDLHFTQYNNAPLLTNPANTGFSPDCDFRIGVNSRTQWAATTVPYKTNSAWADAQLFRNSLDNGWVGLGIVLLNDVAGSGNLRSNKGYVNAAYHQLLNDKNLLSFGLGAGFAQKRIEFDKLLFDDQWNGKFFDANIKTKEPYITNSVSYLDLNAGISYAWFANDNFYLNMGVSLLHINRPSESFFKPNTVDARLSQRLNLFANASIKASDVLILNPNIYYSKISTAEEIVVGCAGQYNLGGYGAASQLLFGINYRNKDAVSPSIGFQINSLQLMFNYDATTSNLTSFSNYRSAYEISVLWKGFFGGDDQSARAMRCNPPKFQ